MSSNYIKIKNHIIHLPSIKYVKPCFTGQQAVLIGFKEGDTLTIEFIYDIEARDEAIDFLEKALMMD
jgi:hypothetical protein